MRGRNRKGQNPLTRVYESNGPDVKIRGTASHVADKYVQLARDAQSSGDPVAAENYFQHAEHYFRLIAAAQEQFRQTQPFSRPDGEPRDDGFEGADDDGGPMQGDDAPFAGREPHQQHYQQHQPHQQHYQQRPPREGGHQSYPPRQQSQPYLPRDPQPYEARDQQSFGGRPQPAAPVRQEGGADPERLPAFITGGQPQPSVPPSYGQNGFEGQPDRFPLHRRRRRRHGPRGDMPGGSPAVETSEEAPPSPPGEPNQD